MKTKTAAWQASLLHTKLFMPPPRADNVARPRLLAQLAQAVQQQHKLVLLSAPPGFGKTTLISEWLHATSPDTAASAIAWLSLDSADNDPARFFLYLIAALDRATGTHAEWDEIAQLLQAPQTPPIEMIVGAIFNTLARRADPVLLRIVLEDYQLIRSAEIHRALSYWLDHAPPQVMLVITARADPPFPRARLRARGQLTEIRAGDLRFRSDEATALLNTAMGLKLAPQQIEALGERTEGWVAGLQLAALALSSDTRTNHANSQTFINAFTGSHNYVVDYLMEEVLARENIELQNFLLYTSVLDRLNAPLCQAILDQVNITSQSPVSNLQSPISNLQSLLEDLERRNLFLVALDEQRTWFRYHHLFADVLRHRLQQMFPERAVALQERASIWFQTHGLMDEAVHYAFAAQLYERAVQLISDQAEAMLQRGEHATVVNWIQALPATTLRAHPDLWLVNASAHLITHQLEPAAHALHEAETVIQAMPPSETRDRLASRHAGIGAMVALNRNDIPTAIALGEDALAHLPADEILLRGAVLLHMGVAYDWTGQLAQAEQAFLESRQLGERAGDLSTALLAAANLGAAVKTHMRYQDAAAVFRQGIQLEERANASHLPATVYLYTDLSEVLYEWDDVGGAEPLIQQALVRCERWGLTRARVTSMRLWARWLAARGDMTQALTVIEGAVQLAAQHQLPHHYSAPARAFQVQLWLRTNDLTRARIWAAQSGILPETAIDKPREAEYLAYARFAIADDRPADALTLLENLLRDAETHERRESVIWVWQLQALALAAQNEIEDAARVLLQAITASQSENFIRSYVDEGAAMQAILVQANQASATFPYTLRDYLTRLLAKFAPVPSATRFKTDVPLEKLTEREVEVLNLVAQGLSDREVANRLVVATGTVKRHLNNIYGKLGVSSRTQALARARSVGWIP